MSAVEEMSKTEAAQKLLMFAAYLMQHCPDDGDMALALVLGAKALVKDAAHRARYKERTLGERAEKEDAQ